MSPFSITWADRITIHSRPMVTWTPCVPTRVKKAERKPLRSGPAPLAIMPANSLTSRKTKPAPNRNVTASQPITALRLPVRTERLAKPKVVLEISSSIVSRAALFRSKRSLPVGPPAVPGIMMA